MSLFKILQDTAANCPKKEAVTCGGKRYSYNELKKRVDMLSTSLSALGVRKNNKIAIIHRNCHRYLEIYFAAAKIGAVLVPINYRLSEEDFVFILNDSQAKWLIAQPDLVSCLKDKIRDLPMLRGIIFTDPAEATSWPDSLQYEILMEQAIPAEESSVAIDDTETAQIYYTSGTTGRTRRKARAT